MAHFVPSHQLLAVLNARHTLRALAAKAVAELQSLATWLMGKICIHIRDAQLLSPWDGSCGYQGDNSVVVWERHLQAAGNTFS